MFLLSILCMGTRHISYLVIPYLFYSWWTLVHRVNNSRAPPTFDIRKTKHFSSLFHGRNVLLLNCWTLVNFLCGTRCVPMGFVSNKFAPHVEPYSWVIVFLVLQNEVIKIGNNMFVWWWWWIIILFSKLLDSNRVPNEMGVSEQNVCLMEDVPTP